MSPKTKERNKIEKKYKKKISKVVETFIGRVENGHTSSGSCSGDEKLHHKNGAKKRNYNEYLSGLKLMPNSSNNSNNGYRIPLTHHKRRQV